MIDLVFGVCGIIKVCFILIDLVFRWFMWCLVLVLVEYLNVCDVKEYFDFVRFCVVCGVVGCVVSVFMNVFLLFVLRDVDWELSRCEVKEVCSGGMVSTARRLYTSSRCADEMFVCWFVVFIEYKIIGMYDCCCNFFFFYWWEVVSLSVGDCSCARRMWFDLRSRFFFRLVSFRLVVKCLCCDLKLIDVGVWCWGWWCYCLCWYLFVFVLCLCWDALTFAFVGILKLFSRIRNRIDSFCE